MANKFGYDFSIAGSSRTLHAKGNLKNASEKRKIIKNNLDLIIKKTDYCHNTHYEWISLLYLHTDKTNLKVIYGKIHKIDKDLPINILLDMKILQWADQNNLELLEDILTIAAIEALIQVGKKYKKDTRLFEEERLKYGNIPTTILECENYNRHNKPNIFAHSINADDDQTDAEDNDIVLCIEYKINGFGSDEDIKKRHDLEDVIDMILKENNLGYCDGGSTGSGTMEVACIVNNFDEAKKLIEEKLKNTKYHDYTQIYEED
jgi:hypothetical protein